MAGMLVDLALCALLNAAGHLDNLYVIYVYL